MDNTQLYDLITRLQSADNEIRKGAEAEYNQLLLTQSIPIMCFFSEAAATTQDEGTKGLLLVLLRKILSTEPSPYNATDLDSQNRIKQYMLHILETAAYGHQRKNAAACVASLAVLVDKNQQTWNELWENIFHIIGAMDSPNELKVVSCLIISESCIAMKVFFETHIATVVDGLQKCLSSEGNLSKEAKAEALNAMSNLSDTGLSQHLTPLVPIMLNLIQTALNTHDWPLCESILECICDAVSRSSHLFETSRVQILTGLMQIASSFDVPQNVRQLAVETLVVFCEEDTKATRKVSQFATSFFTLLFQYLLEPSMSDNWDTVDDVTEMEEYDDLPDDIMAASALDRVASALGGRTLLATTRQLFGEHVSSADWKHRNAAVVLMCYVAEGMAPVLQKSAKDIVFLLLQHVKDENKLVRTNALQALTEFCGNFEEIFMENHATILPVIFECLRDPVPRVVYTACTFIDNFFDHCKLDEEEDDDEIAEQKISERFSPYAEAVCAQCVEVIEKSPYPFVRGSALSALSAYLFIAGTSVAPYTDRLVHVFQSVLALPDAQETTQMKNKALQCVTLLATAVGKETFAPYARDVCEYLKNRCEVGLKADDDSRYVLRGFACMVDCLGEDALPYLAVAMPLLMKRMGEQCDVVILPDLGDDNEPEEEGVEVVRYKVPGVGTKIAKFHTSQIEDKEIATNVIFNCICKLRAAMAPYFLDIANTAFGLLSFAVNDSIRESGALILKEMLDIYAEFRAPEGQQLAYAAFEPLLKALSEEEVSSVMDCLMEAISFCVSVNPAVVSPDSCNLVADKLLATIKALISRKTKLSHSIAQEKDEDEIDALELEREDVEQTIESVTDVIETLLEHAAPVFGSVFATRFFPIVASWLQPTADDFSATRGFAVLCGFVEHAPAFVGSTLPTICGALFGFTSTRTDASLLQTTFYLINTLIQLFAKEPSAAAAVDSNDFARQAREALVSYLNEPSIRGNPSYDDCTCNAVSALVAILNQCAAPGGPTNGTAAADLTAVVKALPVGGDNVEARRVHYAVLEWVVNHNALLNLVPNSAATIVQKLKTAAPEDLNDETKQQLSVM